jgi:hypothetical protein
LPVPPDGLRDAVSARTVDDVRNWWRTIGVAVAASPDPAGVREAMASGAVPVVPQDLDVALPAVRALADPATWHEASSAARSAALAG